MIKRIIIICLVAVLAYYAGTQGLSDGNIADWIEESNITETIKKSLSKTLELAEEKQVTEKVEKIIDDIKDKLSD